MGEWHPRAFPPDKFVEFPLNWEACNGDNRWVEHRKFYIRRDELKKLITGIISDLLLAEPDE